jgi:hypothetical protein
MDKLSQDGGKREGDGETDGKTLPQFPVGRDTHSKFLDDFRGKGQVSLRKPYRKPKIFHSDKLRARKLTASGFQ